MPRSVDLNFSEDQAITTTAVSTNQVKTGAGRNLGDMYLVVVSKVAFTANSTDTLTIQFRTSAAANMGTPSVIWTSATLAKGTCAANTMIVCEKLPPYDMLGYLDLNYVVASAMTAGTLDAYLTDAPPMIS